MDNDTTVGTDLGNKSHKVVWLDERGRVCLGCEFENAKETLEAFVREHPNATVALETGMCCRWICAIARKHCRRVLVGNARKLRAIWESKRKKD